MFDSSLSSDKNTSEEEKSVSNFTFYKDPGQDQEQYPGIKYISGTFWQIFEKKKKLGEGTSGIVRKCIRKEDGKVFAVKIVRTRDDEILFHVSLNEW